MTTWKQKVARFKARQARGGTWTQSLLNFGIISANVKLFQSLYEPYGVSLAVMMVVGAILYILITMVMGYIDENWGIWQEENAYNSNLNPVTRDILGTARDIRNKVVDEESK